MGGYTKTGPFVNNITPPGISSAFLNAVESVLARGTGDTETGKYYLANASYANLANVAQYMSSTSRTSVPISVTIDTADAGPTNCSSPSTANLTANGFRVTSQGSGAYLTVAAGGNTTINF